MCFNKGEYIIFKIRKSIRHVLVLPSLFFLLYDIVWNVLGGNKDIKLHTKLNEPKNLNRRLVKQNAKSAIFSNEPDGIHLVRLRRLRTLRFVSQGVRLNF